MRSTIHRFLAHTLLRVNVITSVSGDSYTAAYYGLFGNRIFGDFAPLFLYRDWRRDLALLLPLRPDHLLSIVASGYNSQRSGGGLSGPDPVQAQDI